MSIFTGEITSEELKKNVVVRVIFPDSPFDLEQINTKQKTMYLLHGIMGSSGDWIRFTRLEQFARLYNFTIVMADAGSSFYANMRYGGNYKTFFAEELPEILSCYTKLPEDTFICGQSMGGYGCMKIGLNYPEKYVAIGSLSGALMMGSSERDKKPGSPGDIARRAAFGENTELREEDDCAALARKAAKLDKRPEIIHICGTEDFLYEDNEEFDRLLSEIGYKHDYWTDKGAHTWNFWDAKMPLLMERLCEFV
ncbi:MAG: alpha/beta hydrolase-fold protein [Eubacteriales bacterium]|nr:alpha/beta hydrolase-fold protein [Eubacteriales bacterium]